jgi:hypothetical protein
VSSRTSLIRRAAVPAVSLSVTAVQEVHERARQQEQIRQEAEDVGGVLGDEKEAHDPEKRYKSDA